MYMRKTLNAYYFVARGFYLFFIPIAVPYKKIYRFARSAGLKLMQPNDSGAILESNRMFGFGWIGIEVNGPKQNRPDVLHVQGDYEAYEYTGSYKKLGQAYKKIMKENPGKKEFLNLYLDDPQITPAEQCRTVIMFH